jgi:hypothetical protein
MSLDDYTVLSEIKYRYARMQNTLSSISLASTRHKQESCAQRDYPCDVVFTYTQESCTCSRNARLAMKPTTLEHAFQTRCKRILSSSSNNGKTSHQQKQFLCFYAVKYNELSVIDKNIHKTSV